MLPLSWDESHSSRWRQQGSTSTPRLLQLRPIYQRPYVPHAAVGSVGRGKGEKLASISPVKQVLSTDDAPATKQIPSAVEKFSMQKSPDHPDNIAPPSSAHVTKSAGANDSATGPEHFDQHASSHVAAAHDVGAAAVSAPSFASARSSNTVSAYLAESRKPIDPLIEMANRIARFRKQNISRRDPSVLLNQFTDAQQQPSSSSGTLVQYLLQRTASAKL